MSSPIISVVVPVYNVEKYLEKCVESILSQTFSDFELILVDDGSTDSSGELCDKLKATDSRIRVIHKPNGGLSDARNKGVEDAVGDFIEFVDSDDFIEINNLEVLYNLIIENGSDIAVGGIYNCYGEKRIPQCSELKVFNCDGKKALKFALEGVLVPGSSCCKLISKDLAKGRNFPLGKTYEDAFYLPELLLATDKISVTTEPLYNYWHRVNSITTMPFSEKAMHVIEAYEKAEITVKNNCPELLDLAKFRLYWSYFTVLDRMVVTEGFKKLPKYKLVLKYLKKNWFKIFRCGYFQKSRRIAVLALKVNVRLYRILTLMKNRRDEVHG